MNGRDDDTVNDRQKRIDEARRSHSGPSKEEA